MCVYMCMPCVFVSSLPYKERRNSVHTCILSQYLLPTRILRMYKHPPTLTALGFNYLKLCGLIHTHTHTRSHSSSVCSFFFISSSLFWSLTYCWCLRTVCSLVSSSVVKENSSGLVKPGMRQMARGMTLYVHV